LLCLLCSRYIIPYDMRYTYTWTTRSRGAPYYLLLCTIYYIIIFTWCIHDGILTSVIRSGPVQVGDVGEYIYVYKIIYVIYLLRVRTDHHRRVNAADDEKWPFILLCVYRMKILLGIIRRVTRYTAIAVPIKYTRAQRIYIRIYWYI